MHTGIFDAVQNRSLSYAAASVCELCSGPVLGNLSAWVQILVQPADTYSIHVDVKTTDRNTTRISISNLFNPDALKVQKRPNAV